MQHRSLFLGPSATHSRKKVIALIIASIELALEFDIMITGRVASPFPLFGKILQSLLAAFSSYAHTFDDNDNITMPALCAISLTQSVFLLTSILAKQNYQQEENFRVGMFFSLLTMSYSALMVRPLIPKSLCFEVEDEAREIRLSV